MGFYISVIETSEYYFILIEKEMKVLHDHIPSLWGSAGGELLVQVVVIDYLPVGIQTVIARGGADKWAGKCIRSKHVLCRAVLDYEFVIAVQLHQFGLNSGEMCMCLEIYERFMIF